MLNLQSVGIATRLRARRPKNRVSISGGGKRLASCVSGSGSVNYCWSSPVQPFLVPSPAGLMSILFSLTTLRLKQLLFCLCLYSSSQVRFSMLQLALVSTFDLGFGSGRYP